MAISYKDLKFGFEFETLVAHNKNVDSEIIKTYIEKIAGIFDWKMTEDKTVKLDYTKKIWDITPNENINHIRNDERIVDEIELVSPIIKYNNIEKQLKYLTYIYKKYDIRFLHNHTTSGHVHISHPVIMASNDYANILSKLIFAWWYFESVFLLLVYNERFNNEYCKLISQSVYNKCNYDIEKYKKFFKNGIIDNIDFIDGFNFNTIESYQSNDGRYIKTLLDNFYEGNNIDSLYGSIYAYKKFHALNISNYYLKIISNIDDRFKNNTTFAKYTDKKNTFEVRLFHGSNDINKISMWMKLMGFFVNATFNNPHICKMFSEDVRELLFSINKKLIIENTSNSYITFDKITTDYADLFHYLKKFILSGTTKDDQDEVEIVLKYWENHWQFPTSLNNRDIPLYGGAKQYKKTIIKKYILGRNRIIYLGKHNKQYVKMKNEFVPISLIK